MNHGQVKISIRMNANIKEWGTEALDIVECLKWYSSSWWALLLWGAEKNLCHWKSGGESRRNICNRSAWPWVKWVSTQNFCILMHKGFFIIQRKTTFFQNTFDTVICYVVLTYIDFFSGVIYVLISHLYCSNFRWILVFPKDKPHSIPP